MDDPNIIHRRVLSSMVSLLSLNTGFVEIETPALETLTELLGSFLYQLCAQVKSYAELQNRTESNYHDVASAFIDLGIDLNSLFRFIRSSNTQKSRNKIMKPPAAPQSNPPQILHVAKARSHPNYIDAHFPEFPDPHSYIHTETEVTNEKEYQKTREIIALQRLNIERSLVKFKIRSNPKESYSIVNEDPLKESTLALIENKVNNETYLSALLPSSVLADL